MNILTQIKRLLGKEDLQSQVARTYSGNRALPKETDEYGGRIPLETLDKIMLDPVVSGAVNILILKVITDGIKVVSPIPAPSQYKKDRSAERKYNKAEEVRVFLDEMINNFSQPITTVLYQILTAVIYGASVCEKVYGMKDDKYIVKDLKYKPRTRYSFAVDEYNNVAGVVDADVTSGPVDAKNLIPKSKLLIFTYKSLYGDPRGQSVLRSVMPYWKMKCAKIDEYSKYLTLFGSPAIVGTLPEMQQGSDPKSFLDSLRNVKSGGDMVVPFGTQINALNVPNNEGMYLNFIRFCNQEMVTGILGSTRATMEAEYGSRADSETSVNLLGDIVSNLRQTLAESLKDDLFYPIVEANWGKDAADKYTPSAVFVEGNEKNIYQLGEMVARLFSCGFLDKSQLQGLDAALNLPERDYDAMVAEQGKPSMADLVDANVPDEVKWKAAGMTDEDIKKAKDAAALKENEPDQDYPEPIKQG